MGVGLGCGASPKESVSPLPAVQSTSNRSHIPFPTPTVLSIFPFEDRTRISDLAWLRTGLADMLIADLANNPTLIVVQRERVEEIIREQTLQLSGRVADESTVKIGRLIGANVVVIGRMAAAEGQLRLDAQLVGVEQGAVLGAATAEGSLNDVANVARVLVTNLRALLPGSAPDAPAAPSAGATQLQTVKANHDGEQLSREGKLFEALEEFEQALALNPNNSVAQTNVARTLERLPPVSWLKPGHDQPDRQVINRIIERLAIGLETDIGRPSIDATGRNGVRIPVSIRLSPAIIDQTLEALKQVDGAVLHPSDQDDATEVRFASHPDVIDALAREHTLSRRLYLRLLSQDGRTIAVYSDFREWSLSNWLSVVNATIRIKRAHELHSEATFMDLTPEQVSAMALVRATIDRVPRERATVRLDVQTVADRPSAGDSGAPVSESRSERHTRETEQDATLSDRMAPLRTLMEEAWRPSVTARPWSRGYVPSNERTAVVALTLDPVPQRVRDQPRLVRPSGEPDFDQAALTAARTGLQQWIAGAGFDSLSRTPALPNKGLDRPEIQSALKIRVQFQLHKDVPALNLIGPHAFDRPLVPVTPPPTTP